MYSSNQSPYILIAIFLLCHISIIISGQNIAISCGSSENSTAPDGRLWAGDSGPESSLPLQIIGKPSSSRAIVPLASRDPVIPYETARASRQEFSYVISVEPGPKFIRLHFNQASFRGFTRSTALFTVTAGPYTLLGNFSPALVSESSGLKSVVNEYCVNIEKNRALIITFIPARKKEKTDDFYAFVNGIEVIPMRAGLYTPEGELGPLVVGETYRFHIGNSMALELVRWMKTSHSSLSAPKDSMMFRTWEAVSSLSTGKYIKDKYGNNHMTWEIPVDLGFRYLIRLHFSKFHLMMTGRGRKEFPIIINKQIAEDNTLFLEPVSLSEGPVHRDYVVTMDGKQMERHLTITFKPELDTGNVRFSGVLNELEVFKLSNPDNNLAGSGPIVRSRSPKSKPPPNKAAFVYSSTSLFSVILTATLALLNVAVYYLVRGPKLVVRKTGPLSTEHPCRRFSINDIQSSTNNFDPQFQIGSGGYGRVYRGSIDGGGTVVAIKRLKPESRQGDNEFWTEVKMLSKMRHDNLVPLIGYCNDGQERALVYQYMARGNLADHLLKTNGLGKSGPPPLDWELRLKISIGAARGLYYLHSKHRIIHRDVKSSNILLDGEWVARISDFGLSKKGPTNDSFTHISTNVKGTFGYLDPEYFLTRKLTRKSDVYAFGVVLFEVLSGRPAINLRLKEEEHSLAGWARYCIGEGTVGQLVDPNLAGEIMPACLKVFVGIAGRCLHTQPQERPPMADVVMALELALVLQQTADSMDEMEDGVKESQGVQSVGEVISMDDVSLTPPKGESGRITSGEMRTNSNGSGGSRSRRWWDPFGILPRTPSKSRSSPLLLIHQFSLEEIQKGTNDFHESLVIGYGGTDPVYKGQLDGIQKAVAVRRSRTPESRIRMAHELQSRKETQTRASPGRDHVVRLIGYCKTQSDSIIIYEHMSTGTFHEHLHSTLRSPLTWKQRLQICIGSAKGLLHIRSTVEHTTLHSDLKSTNIWLDENLSPRVSEWGLSRDKGKQQAPVTMRGNWVHLDSDFVRGGHLTEKSYVYLFGLILFETLLADKEPERWLDEDRVSLAQWIKSCARNGLSGVIDPYLIGRTSLDSVRIFTETARMCLVDRGNERPSMEDIVMRLETALRNQEAMEGDKSCQLLKSVVPGFL